MSRRITSSLKPVSCEMAETANERKHKMRARNSCGIVLLVLTFLCSCNSPFANNIGRKGDFITAFGGKTLEPKYRDVHVSYGLDPKNERYLVHVPESYTGDVLYGLVVFIDAEEVVTEVPDGWASILDAHRMLFVAPENGGNDQDNDRRMGLAVLGALEMMKHYRIDPSRVYVAGYSGGARIAGKLGFYQSDIFHGTIQNCGADFYRQVPTVHATSWLSRTGQPYGTFEATDQEIAQAKRVRFVLVTGTNDFRRGNILDIFNGGFAKEGFKAKLFDVPGMQHTTSSGEILSAALDFIESAALGPDAVQAPQANPSFIPATGQTFYLDLDTAEGAFSQWRHDDLSGLCALHASIRVLRLRNDPKWLPGFTIWLQDKEVDYRRKRLGLQFWTKDRKAPLGVRIIQFDGPKPVGVQSSSTTVSLDATVQVEMVWLPPQSVTIRIGQNETHSLNVSWRIERIAITGSTGQMKIDPLVLGCIGKPNRR